MISQYNPKGFNASGISREAHCFAIRDQTKRDAEAGTIVCGEGLGALVEDSSSLKFAA